jgi:putative ABC transport system substrate-binding protein
MADPIESAQAFGTRSRLQLRVLRVGTEGELDTVFVTLARARAGGLFFGNDAFFVSRSERLAAREPPDAVPSIFAYHEFAAAGCLNELLRQS